MTDIQDCACGARIAITGLTQYEARSLMVHHAQLPRHREWAQRAYPPTRCHCGTCARGGVGCLVVTPRLVCYGCAPHAP